MSRSWHVAFLIGTLLMVATTGNASAAISQSLTPLDSACASLFGLPAHVMLLTSDSAIFNPRACAAYEYLYAHLVSSLPCTTSGPYPVTRQQAVTGLNPTFAVELYTLLQKYPSLMITSAYRKNACQNNSGVIAVSSRTGNDPHQRGCAADLSYNTSDPCTDTSGICYQIKTNARLVGLQLAYLNQPGEANHIQPVNLAACEQSGPAPAITQAALGGPGISTGSTCQTNANGLVLCSQQSNPYSPFGQNGLLGGNNSMTSMMTMMMGMQMLQGLSSSLTSAAQNTSAQTSASTPLSTPLPPIPITPISTTPTTSGAPSSIDELLAALNAPTTTACAADAEVCPDGTTVGRTGPQCSFAACPASTSTPGELAASSTTASNASSTNTNAPAAIGGISISSSSADDLQSAIGSLEQASATLAQENGTPSASTLQTILNALSAALSSIVTFFAHAFGGAASSS